MHALTSLLAALALLATSAGAKAKGKPRDAILLSQVESLTLRADRQTTHRRVPAVPQLKCISPRGICSKYQIDVLRCENKGSGYDSEDIQWSCTASLPPELKLGSTDVICEGYSSPDDPYVLKGSCAVEYRMALTREGEDKWPDLGGADGSDGGAGLVGWVFWVIFFSVLAFIVYNAFINARGDGGNGRRPGANNGGGFWGGGGGGGGGWGGGDDFGNDDPPPPYPGTNNSGKPRRSGGSRTQRGNNNTQQGWRPDFWSAAGGAAAGAAAGYGAGRLGRNNNNTRGNGAGYGGGNYGSTWGSGGGSPSRSGSSGSSNGSGVSSSRHESTGFGSTSRR